MTDSATLISTEEFNQLERALDAEYDLTPVFESDAYRGHWQFCQFVEAHCVCLIVFALDRGMDLKEQRQLIVALDNAKTVIELGLQHISKCRPATPPERVRSEAYDDAVAATLYERSLEHAQEYWLFPAARGAGTTFWRQPGSAVLETRWPLRDRQYWALQRLLPLEADGFNPLWDLVAAISGPGTITYEGEDTRWDDICRKIPSRVTRDGDDLRTNVDLSILSELYQYFKSSSVHAIGEWAFPWASVEKMGTYFSALFALCAYHLVAIYSGGPRLGPSDLCEHHACLLLDTNDLKAKVSQITGLSLSEVSVITQALTYGEGTRRPDPALQPLIPVSATQVALPGALVLSSDWVRNQLSLHARLDPDDFGHKSNVFEKIMTSTLTASVSQNFRQCSDVWLAGEQVDFVLVDDVHKIILLAELRWVLTPGDISEIVHKQAEVRKKTKQVKRKLDKAAAALGSVLKRLKCTGEGWTIYPMVIVEGFAGAPSDHPKSIPIVPSPVFASATHSFDDLRKLYAFFCSPLWLPREGIDFSAITQDKDVLGQRFRTDLVLPIDVDYLADSLKGYAEEANQLPLSDLEALPW